MALDPNEALQPAFLGKSVNNSLTMFPSAASDFAGDADMGRPVRPVRRHVNPSDLHHANVGISGSFLNRAVNSGSGRALHRNSSDFVIGEFDLMISIPAGERREDGRVEPGHDGLVADMLAKPSP